MRRNVKRKKTAALYTYTYIHSLIYQNQEPNCLAAAGCWAVLFVLNPGPRLSRAKLTWSAVVCRTNGLWLGGLFSLHTHTWVSEWVESRLFLFSLVLFFQKEIDCVAPIFFFFSELTTTQSWQEWAHLLCLIYVANNKYPPQRAVHSAQNSYILSSVVCDRVRGWVEGTSNRLPNQLLPTVCSTYVCTYVHNPRHGIGTWVRRYLSR